ncbi:0e6a89ad-f6c2-4d16-8d26-c05e0763c839 [Thermothielavioides terrestris]|uniref:0e6a89ad-f6c2-4d16-8d26-c05e0763c839 n=1 Tax=Thermothielavioides terrestris TaxID=2587410 RepID=A0A446BFA2_9PEZI|nr:0e6a89ad-f6c2-4d16-8d26-c05e0763c839 [Thermothielavioides terrestris]
MITLTKADVDI